MNPVRLVLLSLACLMCTTAHAALLDANTRSAASQVPDTRLSGPVYPMLGPANMDNGELYEGTRIEPQATALLPLVSDQANVRSLASTSLVAPLALVSGVSAGGLSASSAVNPVAPAVPEPAAWGLMAMGLLGVLLKHHSRRR